MVMVVIGNAQRRLKLIQLKLELRPYISRNFSQNNYNYELNNVYNILSTDNRLLSCRDLKDGKTQEQLLQQTSGLISGRRLLASHKANLASAGVLVPLCQVDGHPMILYTLRTTSLGSHKGEVSFPGGNADKSDKDIICTALRETNEEIGIKPDVVDIWGIGSSIPSRDFTKLVYPVVGNLGELNLNDLTPNPREVEEIIPVKLADLCATENWGYTKFLQSWELPPDGRSRPFYILPVFTGAKYRIWGLTAVFTYLALCTIAKGLFKFRLP